MKTTIKKVYKVLGAVIIGTTFIFGNIAVAGKCTNDVWNKVMKRGKVVIGVKADYKPWGYRNTSGDIVGMEIDMAKDVAAAMNVKLELVPVQSSNRMQFLEQGKIDMAKDVAAAMDVKLELVPVQSSNRMQFLEQGKIDMMIATMSDRVDRRKIVGITQPNYYTSGTNIMSPKALGLKSWEDLRGKPVCGKQGAFYNKIVAARYGAKITAFTGNAEAKQALRDKKCIAWVYDDSSIMSDLSSGNWNDFEMPLVSEDDNPWGLAVPLEELSCVFGNFMTGMTYNWHQSGRLIELEKKHGIQATNYLVIQKYRNKDWLEGK